MFQVVCGRKRHREIDLDDICEDYGCTSPKRFCTFFYMDMPMRRQIVGKVLVCGTGYTGELGLGDDVRECRRLHVLEEPPHPVDICAGGMHSLVLTESGDIYSFGCNDEGALGRDTIRMNCSESIPGLVKLPRKALKISAGDSHSACLLANGSVYAWGSFRDSHGNMGLTINGNIRIPIKLLPGIECASIASGADHLVILTRKGEVFTMGCNEQGQLGRITEEWRANTLDCLTPSQLHIKDSKPIDAIWATDFCTFLREAETLKIWAVGLNNYNQLNCNLVENCILEPIETNLKNILQISGGQHHTLVLDNYSRCFVTGRSDYGRLGLDNITEPVHQLIELEMFNQLGKVTYIGCGECCSYAITKEGKLYSWGMGTNHQLGVGNGEDQLAPIPVESDATDNRKMLLVDGGGMHAIFLVEGDKKDKGVQVKIGDAPFSVGRELNIFNFSN